MAIPVWLNLTATATEANVVKTIYGVKLLRNDAAIGAGNLLVAFDHSVDDGSVDYIMLQPQEEWGSDEDIKAKTIYYKSSTGNVPFRLYSKVD